MPLAARGDAMAIRFSGEFAVKRKREEVYHFLTDPNRFAPLLPDYQGMTIQDEAHFAVKVKVGVSYIRGTADVNLTLEKISNPSHALYKGEARLPGGGARITAAFQLSELPEGTRVGWTGEAQVFGKLASLAGGLLDPVAKKNLQKLIDGLQAALA